MQIFHLALGDEWRSALAEGRSYERSTIDRSLAEEGFIHCSTAEQVQATADRYYRGRTDVVLLTIDIGAVADIVRFEPSGDQPFPHLYGPLPLTAVVAAEPVASDADGRLMISA